MAVPRCPSSHANLHSLRKFSVRHLRFAIWHLLLAIGHWVLAIPAATFPRRIYLWFPSAQSLLARQP
jgi:hypothetical protein